MMPPRSSIVWKFFQLEDGGERAVCLKCGVSITYKNQSTTGLIRHVRAKHSDTDDVIERNAPSTSKRHRLNSTDSIDSNTDKPDFALVANGDREPTYVDMLDITPADDNESIGVIVSKLAAVDGIAISFIAKSSFIRRSCEARGVDLPTCPRKIMKIIHDQFEISKEIVKKEIAAVLAANGRFSLSLNTYLSTRDNRTYVAVNLHRVGEYWNLGMLSLPKNCTGLELVGTVDGKLQEFGLYSNDHIVAHVTNNHPLNSKYAALGSFYHQSCHVEGLLLALGSVLYERSKLYTSETNDDDEGDISNDDDDSFSSNFVMGAFDPGFYLKIHADLVEKVRKLAKVFKKTPEYDGELLLDSPTNWTSLLEMLEHFLHIKNVILEATSDKIDFDISDEEFSTLSSIVNALKPVKLGIERLSLRDSNLLTAEAVIQFITDELTAQNTDFANYIKTGIITQFKERRAVALTSLLKFLNNPVKYPNFEKTTAYLLKVAKDLLTRLFPKSQDTAIVEAPSNDEEESLNQKLNTKIKQEIDQTPCLESLQTYNNLENELVFFNITNLRTDNIKNLHNALLTIPPATMQVEGALIIGRSLVSKLETRMSPNSVNALCFLRHFFLKRDAV